MQKVVGSNPISRSESPRIRGAFLATGPSGPQAPTDRGNRSKARVDGSASCLEIADPIFGYLKVATRRRPSVANSPASCRKEERCERAVRDSRLAPSGHLAAEAETLATTGEQQQCGPNVPNVGPVPNSGTQVTLGGAGARETQNPQVDSPG